jgi:hypothetical protein
MIKPMFAESIFRPTSGQYPEKHFGASSPTYLGKIYGQRISRLGSFLSTKTIHSMQNIMTINEVVILFLWK